MGGGYFAARVRKTSWSLLVLCTFLIAGAAALGIHCRDAFYNDFAGPFPVSADRLLEPRNDPRQTYLTVHFDRIRDTEFVHKELVNGVETGKIARRYYATWIGNRLLLVDAPGDAVGPVLAGELEPLSDEIRTKIVEPAERRNPRLAGRFVPQIFVAKDCAKDTFIAFAVPAAILIASLIGLCKGLARVVNPLSHPAYRTLAAIGDVQQLEREIDAEVAAGGKVLGMFKFTTNWVINISALRFQVIRNSELLWIYRHVFTQRYYGIPVNRTHSAILCDRHGVKMSIPAKGQQIADQLLAAYQRIAPWVVCGYSTATLRRWKRNREQMIAEANQTKARLNLPPARPQAA